MNMGINERLFWLRVQIGEASECWIWSGHVSGRYGKYGRLRAHRVAYALTKGEVPAGAVVRHACDNPLCCNPHHLSVGSQRDNIGDARERQRLATGERNGRTTLTEAQVAEIRENRGRLSLSKLAAIYGISKTAAHYIRSGRSWKMVEVVGFEPTTPAM